MLDPKFVEQSFEKFAKAVVKQARANLTRGGHRVTSDLYKSLDKWKVSVGRGGSLTLVFNYEEYGEFQDRGVRGKDGKLRAKKGKKFTRATEKTPFKFTSKMPPFKDLRKWVGQRGFQFRDRATGQFQSYDQTARTIQRSIYRKGIPQTLFFTKPFKRNFKKLPEEILEAFGRDVEQFLSAQFKDKSRFR